ncbi:hypothetical protein DTO063F5_925 [Paecilomyces variotii]|nr:hypothetical protein DTO063F5_925 [Paecilomyces variotii]
MARGMQVTIKSTFDRPWGRPVASRLELLVSALPQTSIKTAPPRRERPHDRLGCTVRLETFELFLSLIIIHGSWSKVETVNTEEKDSRVSWYPAPFSPFRPRAPLFSTQSEPLLLLACHRATAERLVWPENTRWSFSGELDS